MSDAKDRQVVLTRLKRTWWVSILAGAAVGGAAFTYIAFDDAPDVIWAVAAFGLGAMVQQFAFFGLCALFAPGLSSFVVDEEVTIRGDNVVHESSAVETGDEDFDGWIRAYATARGATIALLGTVGAAALMILIFGW